MVIAERETEADNAAYTYMAAVVVLRDAIYAADYAAEKLGRAANPGWARIAKAIVLPKRLAEAALAFFLQAHGDLATNPFGFSLPLQRRTATLEHMVDCRLVAASEVGA